MEKSMARMAHEIIERHPADIPIGFVGIHTRGVPLAHRLAALVAKFDPQRPSLPPAVLDISFHRDDLERKLPVPKGTSIPFAIDNQAIILVDDVLFTGRTIRAALNAIVDLGRPRWIELAVLIDRGHRELPIRPDYIGKNLPTSRDQKVIVRLLETDGIEQVTIAPAPEKEAQ